MQWKVEIGLMKKTIPIEGVVFLNERLIIVKDSSKQLT